MSEFDLHSNIKNEIALNTQDITSNTTTVGEIVDTKGFESIEYAIQSGTVTDGAFDVILEEGDDAGLSDAAPVNSDLILGNLSAFAGSGSSDMIARVGSIGKDRFQRLSIVSTTVTSGGTFSAVAVLGHPHTAPVPEQNGFVP